MRNKCLLLLFIHRGTEGTGVWPDGRRGISPLSCGGDSGGRGCGMEEDALKDCLVVDGRGDGYASHCSLSEPLNFVCSFPGGAAIWKQFFLVQLEAN